MENQINSQGSQSSNKHMNTSTNKNKQHSGDDNISSRTQRMKKKDSKNKQTDQQPKQDKPNQTTRGGGRMGQYKRQQMKIDSSYKKSHGEDLDLSIQEEIMGGNFKMKGRKTKVSINHLLDFTLPEVERETDNNIVRRSQRKKKLYQGEHINLTGDSFINVNYRLLIRDNENYSEQINNPNSIISDDNIVAVVVPSGQSCPICLCEKPIAPRMVGCGHIFCYTCLINFFSVEESIKDKNSGYIKKKKYKECPLCNNIVRPQRIKQVVYLEDSDLYLKDQTVPKQGAHIKLDLMYRRHGSILALPLSKTSNFDEIDNIPTIHNSIEAKYSRLVKCDAEYTLKLLNDDIETIQTQQEIDQALYNDDDKFTKLAIEQINSTIISVLAKNEKIIASDVQKLSLANQKQKSSLTKTIDDESGYFFYTTSHDSSTKFYLSPLDAKILLTIFEKYSNFPAELEIKVENIHYGAVISEQLIRRYKYMSYLPLGTEVAFLDIDWKEIPFLTDEVYEKFKTELKQRRRELNMKKQREDRNKKLYEVKLEEETAAFYRAENGESYPTFEHTEDYKNILHSDVMLDTLWSSNTVNGNISDTQSKKKGYKQNTIWGTSISVIPDEKTSRENDEFAAMLLQKMHGEHTADDSETSTPGAVSMESDTNTSSQSDQNLARKSGKRGKKKKGKVVLFST